MKHSCVLGFLLVALAGSQAFAEVRGELKLVPVDPCAKELANASAGRRGGQQTPGMKDLRKPCGFQLVKKFSGKGPIEPVGGHPPDDILPVKEILADLSVKNPGQLQFVYVPAKPSAQITDVRIAIYAKEKLVWMSQTSPQLVKALNSGQDLLVFAPDASATKAMAPFFKPENALALEMKTADTQSERGSIILSKTK